MTAHEFTSFGDYMRTHHPGAPLAISSSGLASPIPRGFVRAPHAVALPSLPSPSVATAATPSPAAPTPPPRVVSRPHPTIPPAQKVPATMARHVPKPAQKATPRPTAPKPASKPSAPDPRALALLAATRAALGRDPSESELIKAASEFVRTGAVATMSRLPSAQKADLDRRMGLHDHTARCRVEADGARLVLEGHAPTYVAPLRPVSTATPTHAHASRLPRHEANALKIRMGLSDPRAPSRSSISRS